MNPVFREAAQMAQLGWVMGLMTACFLITFVVWSVWAWAPWRREAMERAALLPFDDEGGEA